VPGECRKIIVDPALLPLTGVEFLLRDDSRLDLVDFLKPSVQFMLGGA